VPIVKLNKDKRVLKIWNLESESENEIKT